MNVLILGLGAIGSNLAMNLAADMKQHKYMLLDYDKVEPRNLQVHTQRYSKEQVDVLKANALQVNIYTTIGGMPESYVTKINKPSDLDKYSADLIIDAFDNYDARKCVYDYSKNNKIPCIHIGFSPQMTYEICWNEKYQVPEDFKDSLDICQLSGASSFINYVSALSSIVIQEWVKTKKKRNFAGMRFSVREF